MLQRRCNSHTDTSLLLGAVHKEQVFLFQYLTFRLFLFVNVCLTVTLTPVFCSVSHTCIVFLRLQVKLKEFKLLHAAPVINISSETVDQSEDTKGGASILSFCLQ